MNKKVEIATLAAGGLGLFSMCFLGFALVSDVPLEEMAVIGPLFRNGDEQAEEGADGTLAEADGGAPGQNGGKALALPERRGTAQEIVTANLGVLGAFALPAPFARAELETLVDELRDQRDLLKERSDALDERERQVADQIAALDMRSAELERIKGEIETQTAAIELRSLELKRDEDVETAGESLVYENLATLYAEGDTEQITADLVGMGPDEAAKVLRILDEDRAMDLLRAITGDERGKFIDAWARAQP
ncbi:hypothetical protein [Engelhardtia mirabilis]|uniref:Magnesium transporter MgtE intracellular domain-containing protein n=1 Tax=Engelhardtia mirabilis TaxID=2528011 RepID=A0A518BSU0_9BACT|nr:hypothetical protein Pla133_51540 [Planctomycetes bacterium Pla133]QDV04356.1 hypothetical protein Pla86_51510 [Planctomycetes bacterium Pla86]